MAVLVPLWWKEKEEEEEEMSCTVCTIKSWSDGVSGVGSSLLSEAVVVVVVADIL